MVTFLCREETRKYFDWLHKRSDFFVLDTQRLGVMTSKISGKKNVIYICIDDSYRSKCKSIDNTNLEHPNLRLLICENFNDENCSSSKLFRWPIGLESKLITWPKRNSDKTFFTNSIKTSNTNASTFCINHGTLISYPNPASGGRDDRANLKKALIHLKNVTNVNKKIPFKEYCNISQCCKYSLCPEGNGYDTHRFYEMYALGVIPVIRKGVLTPLHKQFPETIIIDEWVDFKNVDSNMIKPQLDLKYVTLDYWLYKALRPICKIIVRFSYNDKNYFDKFMHSAKKHVGLLDSIICVPTDSLAYEEAKNHDINILWCNCDHTLKYMNQVLDDGFIVLSINVKSIDLSDDPFKLLFSKPNCDIAFYKSDSSDNDENFFIFPTIASIHFFSDVSVLSSNIRIKLKKEQSMKWFDIHMSK